MNWNSSESSGVNRSVSTDALTEAMRDEERRMVTIADDLTAASDSELPTAIGRAMNGGGGGADAARRVLVVGLSKSAAWVYKLQCLSDKTPVAQTLLK